jgi:hypothetical protein
MILVVADTTPLRYLVEIDYDYLLPKFFTKCGFPAPSPANCGTNARPS